MNNLVSGLPLNRRQLATLIAIGIALWFGAAMMLRMLGPMGIYEGSSRIWLYLLVIPGTLPFVPMTAWLAALATDQKAIGLAIVTASAMLVDGIALAWFPRTYADTTGLVAAAGAVILWGAGVGIVLGMMFNRTRAR